MVEQTYNLDAVFSSLSDPTRRDIIKRISQGGMNISDIAKRYTFSFAGIAKHLEVLERAGLVKKTRRGKEQIVSIEPLALVAAHDFFEDYKQLWEQRLDSLGEFLQSTSQQKEEHASRQHT